MRKDTCIFCSGYLKPVKGYYSTFLNRDIIITRCDNCNVKITFKCPDSNFNDDDYEIDFMIFLVQAQSDDERDICVSCYNEHTIIEYNDHPYGFILKINNKCNFTPENIREKIKRYLTFS